MACICLRKRPPVIGSLSQEAFPRAWKDIRKRAVLLLVEMQNYT